MSDTYTIHVKENTPVQRHDRVIKVCLRSHYCLLLSAKCKYNHCSFQGYFILRQRLRHPHHHGNSRGVVICAGNYLIALTEMVEVGSYDNGFLAQGRIGTRDEPYHIASPAIGKMLSAHLDSDHFFRVE